MCARAAVNTQWEIVNFIIAVTDIQNRTIVLEKENLIENIDKLHHFSGSKEIQSLFLSLSLVFTTVIGLTTSGGSR